MLGTRIKFKRRSEPVGGAGEIEERETGPARPRIARGRRGRPLAMLIVLIAIAGPAQAEASRPVVTLKLKGGSAGSVQMCGSQRTARIVNEGRSIVAAGRRRGAGRVRLTVQRCQAGTWRRVALLRSRRGTKRFRKLLPTLRTGDYRVRAAVGRRRSRRVYLRVGVGEIVDVPVSFRVRNVNRSQVKCPADGREYTVRGSLVAPRALLEGTRRSVTLLQHGSQLGGEVLWRLKAVPGYDHSYEMARLGHASVSIDNLGYGTSDIPNGLVTCLGALADVDHQVIEKLRAGDYSAGGRRGPSFARVALAGLSMGGLLTEIEGLSFDDADALVVMGWSTEMPTPWLFTEIAKGAPTCARGGDAKRPGEAKGYTWFVKGSERPLYEHVDPRILAAHQAAHERDVCGLFTAVPGIVTSETALVPRIHSPVLAMCGEHDVAFPAPTCETQKDSYTGTDDFTAITLKDTGHIMHLERTAPTFRRELSRWLRKRGL